MCKTDAYVSASILIKPYPSHLRTTAPALGWSDWISRTLVAEKHEMLWDVLVTEEQINFWRLTISELYVLQYK